jgi:hypothetical protein
VAFKFTLKIKSNFLPLTPIIILKPLIIILIIKKSIYLYIDFILKKSLNSIMDFSISEIAQINIDKFRLTEILYELDLQTWIDRSR